MDKPTIVPFIKWVGGKRQLLKEIDRRLPKSFNTYHEPFVGGGALLFYLQPKKAFISDLNLELINTYQVIKTKYKILREYLLLMEYGHSELFYKEIRMIDRNNPKDLRKLSMQDTKVLRAARFIYLNKAGFNGLYRVNSQGMFNVPSGKKEKVKTHDLPNLELVSNYLKENEIKITKQSFTNVIKQVKSNDFVYFDPPYDYEKNKKGFTSYQKEGFGTKGQIDLANLCKELHKKDVKFLVSNHNTTLIQELYNHEDFYIDVIRAKRIVGGKGSSREDVEEVLVRNYEI